jgi:superfamily II DNA or RNA helicase
MLDTRADIDSINRLPLAEEKLFLANKLGDFLKPTTKISLGDIGNLFPNQLNAINKLYQFLLQPGADDIGYMVQPTGSGKTLIMALIVKLFDVETLMLVPRINLLEYTKNELISLGIAAEDIGIVGGGMNEVGRKITLSTYQSHLSRINEPTYSAHNKRKKFIVCDEAHTALGEKTRASIARVLVDDDDDVEYEDLSADEFTAQEAGFSQVVRDYQGQAFILGFTATPQLAGKHVNTHFKNEIAREGLVKMISAGILAKLRVAQLPGDIQRGVEIVGRRMTQQQKEKILYRNDAYRKLLDKYEQVFEGMLADDQIPRAVARCTNIEEAKKFADLLTERGYKAELCTSRDADAKTPEQQRLKLAWLEAAMLAGKLDVIITVDKLAMGWNFPAANIAIDATASASPAKIIQFLGRILRRAKDKKYATLICMSWLVQFSSSKKQSNGEAQGDDHADLPLDNDPESNDDDHDEKEGSGRRKRYDFFRALLDSGEDIDTALRIFTDESGHSVTCNLDEIQDVMELDAKYFSSPEKVRRDLSTYAYASGIDIAKLTTGKPYRDVSIVCGNGESVTLNRYLIRASQALGLDSSAASLVALKRLIGLEVKKTYLAMDAVYYQCADCVRADLQKYAETLGVGIAQLVLNASFNACSVICQNGEPVKGQRYLRRAMVAFGSESAGSALAKLKKLVGLEIKTYLAMDAVYFQCADCVRADLEKYAQTANVDLVNLNTSPPYMDVGVTCANQELVIWATYLNRAGKALGIESKAQTCVALKKLIGLESKTYIDMDAVYFHCVDCVRGDLQKYAKAAKVSVLKLTTAARYISLSVTCANGEEVIWETYYYRAKRALGLATYSAAVIELKKLTNQYDVLDGAYFAQNEKVKHDLHAYAAAAGIDVDRLSDSSHLREFDAVPANGETIKWGAYLNTAMKALNATTRAEALTVLKRLCSGA